MTEKELQPKKSLVTIKGSNEGLAFILNDQEPFSHVADELKQKVRRELSTLLTGPMVRIKIDCGRRELDEKQRKLLEEIISLKENLILTRIKSSTTEPVVANADKTNGQDASTDTNTQTTEQSVVHLIDENTARIYRGTVRSGQVLEHDGNLVIFGDVNAGAKVLATGDILVMGRILGGSVHAGSKGDKQRVISAGAWGNAQVRIADCIGKTQAGDFKAQTTCVTTAYFDEYRIQFKHKKPAMI
ncbi:septum site-determining protein MinC [Desulfuribacillus alkaliarsenatis]|uniref:Probable septum site-determining protein MinC n=1 Tax=Desulfuribacillus alkaliarsenatis TaxID=766136 RepID=A0A1E5G591_9FIRM|nr:septum site-determining protein MinC [Desulfuribacillus alkaliarsenatis]OEF98350.1 septum site-determining protein MinC [Desulfuribacillus alkaliarsenatis]